MFLTNMLTMQNFSAGNLRGTGGYPVTRIKTRSRPATAIAEAATIPIFLLRIGLNSIYIYE